MKPTLKTELVERIFARLIGIYGAQFKSKFSQVEAGVDVGIEIAKAAWATELGGFGDKLEAIAYALDHLPTEHAPNALEFRDICRRAPAKQKPAIEYKPTIEDEARAKAAIASAAKALKPKDMDGIDRHWGTHPVSDAQLKFIFDAARRDPRFQSCVDWMVEKGICTADGHLLKFYRDQSWINATRRAA